MPVADLASLKIHDSHRAKSSTGKKFGIFAAIVGVLVLAAGSFVALRGRTPTVEVAAARPASGAAAEGAMLNATGYVTPRRRATVAAKITGRVTGVFFDEGVFAKEGQLLATLDDSDARKALDAAKADRDAQQAAIQDLQVQLRLAEIQLKRTQELAAAKVESQEQLDTATANADSLKAKIMLTKEQVAASQSRIAEAQQNVDNCTIRAPFSGMIVSKDAQIGEMVSPVSAGGGFTRTGIATIVDMNSNEVEVDVNEAYISRVKPGGKVISILDAYPDRPLSSHVRTIIPTADRQKATVKVRISFDKLEPWILPDMGVKVAFLPDEPKKDAKNAGPAPKAIIPKSAVRKDGSESFVLVVKDGKLERRGVTLGNDLGDDVEVMAGVAPSDSLVVKGPESLRDGESVAIRQ